MTKLLLHILRWLLFLRLAWKISEDPGVWRFTYGKEYFKFYGKQS